MSIFKLEIDVDGFNEVRRSAEIRDDLLARGLKIADAASAGNGGVFDVIEAPSQSRARVVVITADETARRAEATDRALTKAFDAGRG